MGTNSSDYLVYLGAADSWFKADAGVTQSSGAVSSWADQGSKAKDLVQASGPAQPTYVTNVQNGLPAIRFTSAQSLQAASRGNSSNSSMQSVLLFRAATPSTNFTAAPLSGTGNGFAWTTGQVAGTNFSATMNDGVQANVSVTDTAALVANANKLLAFNSFTKLYTGLSSTPVATGSARNVSTDILTTGSGHVGDLMEFFLWDSVSDDLTAQRNRNATRHYLNYKWNLGL